MPSDYVIALNATVYYATIHIGQPLNTPVFRIRAFVNSTADISGPRISLSQTGQINKLFEFEGVTDDSNSITIPKETFVSVGGASVFDTSINLVQHPDTEFADSGYPVTLSMDISFVALQSNSIGIQVTAQGKGSIQGTDKYIPEYLTFSQFIILQIHVQSCRVSVDLVLLVLVDSTLVTVSLDSQEPTVMRILMTVLVVNVSTVLVWILLETTLVNVSLDLLVPSVTRKSMSVTLQTATMEHALIS